MPVILALDTSTPRVSVAIWHGGNVHGAWFDAGRRTGAVLAVAVADLLSAQRVSPSDLTGVAVGVGPGPYTSLRVGVTFATTVAHARRIPAVGACSHDVIARKVVDVGFGDIGHTSEGSPRVGPAEIWPASAAFTVATDARRREVYLARYSADGKRLNGPVVMSAEMARQQWPTDRWVSAPHLIPGSLQHAFPSAEAGEVAALANPDARVLAQWAASAWPVSQRGVGEVPQQWDAAAGDGAAAGFVPQSLLLPQPLYLRRPDATEPVRT